MSLGSPRTTKTTIGTFELRIGPLSQAGRLTASHSVGIIDQVKLDIQMDSTDLLTGFPQKPADTAITRQVSGISATLRESSARNLNILLGNGLLAGDTMPSDWKGELSGAQTANDTTLSVTNASGTAPKAGEYVVVYAENNPGKVTIDQLASDYSGGVLTLVNGLVEAYDSTDVVRVYKATSLSGGDTDGIPAYFTAQLIRLDRNTSRPVGFNFWKTTISSGMSIAASVADFASFDLQLKALEPSDAELEASGSFYHIADTIKKHRVFQVFDVSDSASA